MSKRSVFGFALSRLDLQAGLDNVARGREVSGRHTRNGACSQELDDSEFLGRAFAEEIALEMIIAWEVDGGEGDVTQQTGAGTFVETHKTQVLDDPHGGASRDVGMFGHFTLHL